MTTTRVDVVLDGHRVGDLHYQSDGRREASSFAYDPAWLANRESFSIDPLLPLVPGHQYPQVQRKGRSPFFGCFADSQPDGWGRNIIRRDRLKRGLRGEPNAFDYLTSMHDESRVGALRLRDAAGTYLAQPPAGHRVTPPLLDLAHLFQITQAVEQGTETAEDLRYLIGQGSPLGGQRPKATIRDEDGSLSLGKFPSVSDEREVVRGEVLALLLAERAGIRAATCRLVRAGKVAVAVIRRFDRDGDRRIPYVSAETFLGVQDEEDHSYLEMANALRQQGAPNLTADIEELWRRMVFNIMVSNFDDHLHNHGFLHVGRGQWRLAPAFDVNPTPGKARELKTWISEDLGPSASIELAMDACVAFGISSRRAKAMLSQVADAADQWHPVATSQAVGMSKAQAQAFADAFEHEERQAARKILLA